MAKLPYEERVMLMQEGRIDFLQFIMDGEEADDFLWFCNERSIEPSPSAAELYLDMTDLWAVELQTITANDYES